MKRIFPEHPVRLAVIGAGNRSFHIYTPSYESLKPWVEVVAVCDPVREHANRLANRLGARAYYDIKQLVRDNIAEAALVITPVDSHHSISVYLSSHGIHNMVETTWCNTLRQANEMIDAAKRGGVITCVSENFFRQALDRFTDILKADGYLGEIKRIYSYNDHTGYHNTNRWIHFAGSFPVWVQMITHTMPTVTFAADPPTRVYDSETYRTKFYGFPDGFAVIDNNSNIKSFLGRQPRPGYTEWQGTQGTFLYRGRDRWQPEARIRKFIDYKFTEDTDVIYELDRGRFRRLYAALPERTIEYDNPYEMKDFYRDAAPDYSMAIMDQIVDFALAVRGIKELEYRPEAARFAILTELAFEQSAREDGKRLMLREDMTFEVEKDVEKRLIAEYGVDPYDVEGMIALSFPRK